MYVVMNRFPVRTEDAEAFVELWKKRETRLPGRKGFKEFRFFKLDDEEQEEGVQLFASYTLWEDKADFEAWVNSEEFKHSHTDKNPVGKSPSAMVVRHPKLERFEQLLDR